jgi:hypothetical protein
LSPEVLANTACVAKLKTFSNAEFGTHLHEEFIGPDANMAATNTHSIQANLTRELEFKKMENLTRLFHSQFGYAPKSFRAGRFGISTHTFDILKELQYKVDSSITPFKTLVFDNLTINHWGEKPWPYQMANSLIQVPVSIINTSFVRLPKFVLKRLEDRNSILKKIFYKLGYHSQTNWLRPMRLSGSEMIQTAIDIINHTPEGIVPTLNIMFHSNEILAGTSPYCQTQDDIDYFIRSLDELYTYLFNHYQICSIGLGDCYAN